ncbi:MAG: hypothetical protein K1X72_07875 [Pyrinomonadaceae bacterium]|nr:hypothetical protein [Pyrinomonadaceae bacterium]
MLKKSVLMSSIFFGFLLTAQTQIFAQREMSEDSMSKMQYENVVIEFKDAMRLLIEPRNTDEWDTEHLALGEIFRAANERLRRYNIKHNEYWTKEKEKCRANKFWKTKGECQDAMDNSLQEDALDYIKAVDELKKINKIASDKLNAARKKFNTQQQIRHNTKKPVKNRTN